jgi:tRNA (cytidine/uridine-2'-O-)-methyltransferase
LSAATVDDTHGPDMTVERHVVLVAPEIHWNTGNIGRTCLAVGATLHLVRPLGFSLESREVKRAGLDYWPNVRLRVWDTFAEFEQQLVPAAGEVAILTKLGRQSFRCIPAGPRLFLVFGSETQGLPAPIRQRFDRFSYHIPINAAARSLNLSTAVAIALYESLRYTDVHHAWPPS